MMMKSPSNGQAIPMCEMKCESLICYTEAELKNSGQSLLPWLRQKNTELVLDFDKAILNPVQVQQTLKTAQGFELLERGTSEACQQHSRVFAG